jgi:hypothetical protein
MMTNETVRLVDNELTMLAKELRTVLDADKQVESRVREEWTESKLQVIEVLTRAKRKFPNTQKFGDWLEETGNDDLSHQDRAAAINLGQDLDLARQVLLEANRWSLRYVWEDHKGTYDDHLNKSRVTYMGNSKSKEKPSVAKETTEQKPDIISKWGEKIGRPILTHFDHSRARTIKNIRNTLTKAQAITLAEFVTAHAGKLPTPNNSTDKLGLRTIWREAPEGLCRRYTFSDKDGACLMQVLADWPGKLAPLYAAWIAAGEPDPNRWYNRIAPMPQAVAPVAVIAETAPVAAAAANVTVISDVVAAIHERARKDAEAFAIPKPDPSCRPSFQGPIRHHGVDIWPSKNPRYTFIDAWYAITMWHFVDAGLRASQPNARARAAGFLKVYVGCLRNLNPAAGEALAAVLSAQSAHPDKTGREDNECPPYDSIQ